MKRLYVFADFDWLKEPRMIGELSYESLRGSDSYGFCYNAHLLIAGNRFLRKRRSVLSAVFHPLTILSESKTTPAWVGRNSCTAQEVIRPGIRWVSFRSGS